MGRIDQARLETAAQDAGARFTVEAVDIEAYLASQVADTTHREVAGPLSPVRCRRPPEPAGWSSSTAVGWFRGVIPPRWR